MNVKLADYGENLIKSKRDDIISNIDNLIEKLLYWRKEALKKDEEIEQKFIKRINYLEGELKHCPICFSQLEQDKYKNFREKHLKKCRCGKFSISFEGTGLGSIYSVRCEKCGEEEDITDITSW